MAQPYGQETGKMMSYFTGVYRPAARTPISTVVETEDGAPNGYAAPGMIFLSPRGIGKAVRTASCWPTRSRGSGGRSWSRRRRAITCG